MILRSEEILQRRADEWYRPPIERFMIVAGEQRLGLGELLALRWHDVDLAGARLTVRRSLRWLHGAPTFGDPKTAGSRRELPLPAPAQGALRWQAAQQYAARSLAGGDWQEHDLVFPAPTGAPPRPPVNLESAVVIGT